jgi:hypothetical protein
MVEGSEHTFVAQVVSGKGATGTKPPEREEKREEIRALTGTLKVPGSLNLLAPSPIWFKRKAGIRWTGGYLFPARIGHVDVLLNKQLAKVAAQPCLMHAYAAVNLRDELRLEDGSRVEVVVARELLARWGLGHDLVLAARLARRRMVGSKPSRAG